MQAWRDAGLPLSTTSNDAAKMYDAVVSQVRVSGMGAGLDEAEWDG